MIGNGSRIMVVQGQMAGKMGTVFELDMSICPEIIAIMDSDKRKEESMRYSYVRYRDVIEV